MPAITSATAKQKIVINQPTQDGGKPVTTVSEAAYLSTVLALYIGLPDTPRRAGSFDKTVARSLFQQGVTLHVVETAMLLGSLRRCGRPPGSLPLSRIRSLAYFCPLIEELQQQPRPATYLEYLRHKASQAFPPLSISEAAPAPA